jgi:hypothetical protein
VQQRIGKELGGRLEVKGNGVVVTLAGHPSVAVAEVCRAVEQLLVVGADVEVDGDDPVGVDASPRRVDGELAERDVGAVDTPVADSQDLLCVGHHDQIDIVGTQTERLERRLDILGPVDRQIHRPRVAVVGGPLLDRVAHGGVIDDRQQLVEMVTQQLEIQDLVAVVDLVEIDVLLQIGGLLLQLRIRTSSLLIEGLDSCG